METINITHHHNFLRVFRSLKPRFQLTLLQFTFLLVLIQNGYDYFRACEVEIPGLSYRLGLEYLRKLTWKGYLRRNGGKVYSITEKARMDYKGFVKAYYTANSSPFQWKLIILGKVGHLFRTKPGHLFRSKVGQAFWSKVGHYFKVQLG